MNIVLSGVLHIATEWGGLNIKFYLVKSRCHWVKYQFSANTKSYWNNYQPLRNISSQNRAEDHRKVKRLAAQYLITLRAHFKVIKVPLYRRDYFETHSVTLGANSFDR